MIRWYLAPYKLRHGGLLPCRYCSMDDSTHIISADGGKWHETEILGDQAVVCVEAKSEELFGKLGDHFKEITEANAKQIISDAGYLVPADKTALADILAVASYRRKPRWDEREQRVVCDGGVVANSMAALSVRAK